MCYNCEGVTCNACGKFDSDLFVFSTRPNIECLYCGSVIDSATNTCSSCGKQAFALPGQSLKNSKNSENLSMY